jgi:hypothetical protein
MAPHSASNRLVIDLGLEPEPKAWEDMSSAEQSDAILRDADRRQAELRLRVERFLNSATALHQMVFGKEGFINELVRDDILQIARTPLEEGILKAVLKQELLGRQKKGRLKSLRARYEHARLLFISDFYNAANKKQFAEWYLYESPLGPRKKRGSEIEIEAEIDALLGQLVLAEKQIEGRARKPKRRART